eukprot:TRINITY_DN67032_c9_g1_i1.p1 TRINITY_DN67032_c9_g1~~TRINITY_DN67032_c9_g1_i1.p1  ORF type:complete len:778 (-),score=56.68 TRINITY_DN67032_c9_g1_i1:90-2423(-)
MDEDVININDLPSILRDITTSRTTFTPDLSLLEDSDDSLLTDDDTDRAFLTELQHHRGGGVSADTTMNSIDTMLNQWRDVQSLMTDTPTVEFQNQTSDLFSKTLDSSAVEQTTTTHTLVTRGRTRRTLSSYKPPKRSKRYEQHTSSSGGTGTSPLLGGSSQQLPPGHRMTALERLNEKLYRIRTNPDEYAALQDRVKRHRRLIRRVADPLQIVHQSQPEIRAATQAAKSEAAKAHRAEVLMKKKMVYQEKQHRAFESAFRVELAHQRKEQMLRSCTRKSQAIRWICMVAIASRANVHLKAIKASVSHRKGMVKETRVAALILKSVMPRIWRRRRNRIQQAWHTFQLYWHFFRMWLPTKRRVDSTLVIRSFLQSQFSYVSTQRAIRLFRSKVILIQRAWRRATHRAEKFKSILTDQFVDEEKKLIHEEINKYNRATKKMEKDFKEQGKSHSVMRFTVERVRKEELMDLPPEERRRLMKSATHQAKSNFRVLHALRVPDEEATMFNCQRCHVPIQIREAKIEAFYRDRRTDLLEEQRVYQRQMEAYNEGVRQADFVSRVKDMIRLGKQANGDSTTPQAKRTHYRHSFNDTSSPEDTIAAYSIVKQQPESKKLLSKCLGQMKPTMTHRSSSVAYQTIKERPKRPFLCMYYRPDIIRNLIHAARADVVELLQQKRAALLNECHAVTEVFYLMQQFKKNLIGNQIDLATEGLLFGDAALNVEKFDPALAQTAKSNVKRNRQSVVTLDEENKSVIIQLSDKGDSEFDAHAAADSQVIPSLLPT